MELKIGCDPELFLYDPLKGEYVSAHGMIPGTKSNPFKVHGGAVQVDGMAVEINIDPATNRSQFASRIFEVMEALQDMLPGYELHAVPTAHFSDKVMGDQCKEALELGCDPDYNAWTGEQNPTPDGSGLNFRTGAGHIHIGWTEGVDPTHPKHFEACCQMAKQLDFYLGVPATTWDKDEERSELYGCFGAFRPKSYGMEYRTLSNAWLVDADLMFYVFEMAERAFNDLVLGNTGIVHATLTYDVLHRIKGKVDRFLIAHGLPTPPKKSFPHPFDSNKLPMGNFTCTG